VTTPENPLENPLTDWPTLQPWAVVGVSDNPEKYGHIIYRDLKTSGYRVYGVNPKLTTILGDPCYAALKDLPEVPAVVNLVIPPQATPAVLRECAELGITRVWFQPGAESDDALTLAANLGLNVLANACIMIQKAPA
jgi:uncharacterized protein